MKRRLFFVVTLLAGWNLLSGQSLPDPERDIENIGESQ